MDSQRPRADVSLESPASRFVRSKAPTRPLGDEKLHPGDLQKLFTGKKAKWLPLYRRLLARLSRIPGIEVVPARTVVHLGLPGEPQGKMAQIRVTLSGLECRMALSKAQLKSPRLKPVTTKTRPAMSHRTLLADPADLDDELMTWFKAAKRLASQ